MSSLDLLCVWGVGAWGPHVTGRGRPMAEVSGLKKKTAFKSCENRHNIEQRGWGGCGELPSPAQNASQSTT